jgi:ADP-ribose pyrophosphatase
MVTIEVPSGLIDAGESPAESALRELKEETGYVGTIPEDQRSDGGWIMWHDPGVIVGLKKGCSWRAPGMAMLTHACMQNTNTKMMFVDVDMSDPRNRNPQPELEDGEYITCFSLPLATLWEDLTKLDEEGFAIDARVATIAQGCVRRCRNWLKRKANLDF